MSLPLFFCLFFIELRFGWTFFPTDRPRVWTITYSIMTNVRNILVVYISLLHTCLINTDTCADWQKQRPAMVGWGAIPTESCTQKQYPTEGCVPLGEDIQDSYQHESGPYSKLHLIQTYCIQSSAWKQKQNKTTVLVFIPSLIVFIYILQTK